MKFFKNLENFLKLLQKFLSNIKFILYKYIIKLDIKKINKEFAKHFEKN